MLSTEIQNAEIIDWWETERYYVWTECSRQSLRLTEMANEIIDGLSAKDTIWIKSASRDDLKRKIGAGIELHNRRIASNLTTSYERSVGKIEELSELGGAARPEYAVIAASVAVGAGAIGLAVGAGAFVPTTTFMLFVIPVGTLGSWPIAATLGVGAASVALLSPKVGAYATGLVRKRYKRAVGEAIQSSLLSEDDKASPSSWKMFSTQLDALLQSRLHDQG